MTAHVSELAPGLWRWAARHPEWHPGAFGSEVASYALRVRGDDVLLIDPLLPEAGGEAVEEVDALLAGLLEPSAHLHVYITIPYHVRSTREIVRRAGARRTTVWGERRAARRLAPDVEVRAPSPAPSFRSAGER